ncbi:SDR family NAD(P)-dependent oxidoreductase [Natrinema halophilum]|uniref:Polysaccharide biosynthesis protein n=1 Tax=Natrinema halophilum TaxID=1699371 RepID=A0A7D5KIU0_9EURY|nr:SDR family NAD(P)-dependent oxidoreductase [Natrinema halophilum]QLG48899.1 polysaccharide biosynthesis protein [Natrinema halophilum]
MIAEQNVLITGAGSVGRRIARHCFDHDANIVRLFDNNEPRLAQLQAEIDDDRCRFLIGDVRDDSRLERAMQNVDIVIHTAAMKHVDISEYNAFEAVKTNVLGLQNLIDAAIDNGVERVVFTSSDKAVDPVNTMGTTKLLGEKLVTAAHKYSGRGDLRLTAVRFGNVINSSQSVVPIFHEQISNGGPVTLTDSRMTRFFLSYTDVTSLITEALERTAGGETFIYKMPAMRIEDLAEAMIETMAPTYDYDPSAIEIEEIGRGIGETFDEKIMTEREARRAVENETLYAIPPDANGYLDYEGLDDFEPADDIVRSSGNEDLLTKGEIIDFIRSDTDLLEEQ